MSNISSDLVWEICNSQNAFLCKRKMAGGVQFSRDPFNLVNKHSRKYAGFASLKAIGVQRTPSGEGIVLMTKTPSKINKPKTALHTTTYGNNTSSRKIYSSIVNSTTKRGYRSDLRQEAVARASALKLSQKPKKEAPAPKLRGKKAAKATAAAEV